MPKINNYKIISQKIINGKAVIGIVGLGYVGLPLAIKFIKKKIKVVGYDIDQKKINSLKKGSSYLKNVKTNYFKKNKNVISSDVSILNLCDVVIICLPTPLKNNKPDMSYLFGFVNIFSKILKKDLLIVLESTVYPGASREILNKIVLNKNSKSEIYFGYSPERENPGDKNFSYFKTPKVISAISRSSLYLTKLLYKPIVNKIISTKNLETAELSKLLENLYRAVNIGLINEFKLICEKLNVDVFDVINAASTKNFGFQKFLPGPGWGGHCIPIDPFYLSWLSKKKGYNPKIIQEVGQLNNSMPNFILKKIFKTLGTNIKILLIGLSYKKNIDDDRESPAYEFMKILKRKKIFFDYYDPYFPKTIIGRVNKIKKTCIKFNSKIISKYDASIIITDHDKIDYKKLYKSSRIIFDTRGVMKKLQKHDKIKKITFV